MMDKRKAERVFDIEDERHVLRRLSDAEEDAFRAQSIALDCGFAFRASYLLSQRLNLAETFAVCRSLFGERGRHFDDWKSAFNFPLLVEASGLPDLLIRVQDFRGAIDFTLYRRVAWDDPRRKTRIIYPMGQSDWPSARWELFMGFFVGYLEGYFDAVKSWLKQPFLLHCESNLILYGFDGERFFVTPVEREAHFSKQHRKLAETLPSPPFFDA